MLLKGKSILYTIIEDKGKSAEKEATKIEEDKAKAISLLRHHLNDGLKMEYHQIEDPKELWEELNGRYGHNKSVLLPRALDEWRELRFQDFKNISDYNSALHQIKSKLVYCEQKVSDSDMIEKTLSTFHTNQLILQQQYRERNFSKYHELLKTLLVAEQNNELLVRNHNRRPTGSMASQEINAIEGINPQFEGSHGTHFRRGRGRGNFRGRGRGFHGPSGRSFRGRGNGSFRGRGRDGRRGRGRGQGRGYGRAQSWSNRPQNEQLERNQDNRNICNRCGMTGHWSRTCRTAKHLVELYQASLKGKGKAEVNFVNEASTSMPTLDISDFIMEE